MSVYLTWRELRDAINNMPSERLDDPVQIWPDIHEEEPIGLHGVYEIGTVGGYSDCEDGAFVPTRGVLDNKHHPEHFVLLADGNPFSPEGDQWYELTEDMADNKTGVAIEFGERT